MNLSRSLVIGLVTLVPVVAAPMTSVAEEATSDRVTAYCRLLIGRPEATDPAGARVTIVPGTIVLPGGNAEKEATDFLRLIDDLKASYRLAQVDPTDSAVVSLEPGATADLPTVGGLGIRGTLINSTREQATYRITLTEGGKTLAEPTISVRHGGRAVVGSRDGEAAPYVFLVIEPLPRLPSASAVRVPKLLERVTPTYPEAARNARLEGMVLIECTIGADGTVKSTRVVRGEPMGLTEAAIKAVSQWKFDPVRNDRGEALQSVFTVTIRFALD